MKRVRVGVVAVLCAAAIVGSSTAVAAAQPAPPLAATAAGMVKGASQGGVNAFLGVPFAAPPTGERRFMPPADVVPWSGTRDATRFGAACMQDRDEVAAGVAISEDCLTANVWTRPGGGAKPVMVFIHGGGFIEGSTTGPVYNGADLARRDVVVVTLQYRFGPFGYLDLSSSGNRYASSANNGLLDQIAGLRWVRDNIANFGGDPNNVTLFGESAGGISIAALMGSPKADNLYQRVILQSGTAANVSNRQLAQKVSRQFRQQAGAANAQQLKAQSATALQQAAARFYDEEFSDTAFGPVVDGIVLPTHPMVRLKSGRAPRVPTMITTTRDEVRYWINLQPAIEYAPEAFYRPWLANLVGNNKVDAAIAPYRVNRPGLTPAQVGMALTGDVAFREPSIRTAEILSDNGVPVWMGMFTVTSPKQGGKLGAPHAIDLGYVFGNLAANPEFYGTEQWRSQLSDRVQDWWVDFARTGTPGKPEWQRYDRSNRATLLIDARSTVRNNPWGNERRAFATLPYDGQRPTVAELTPLSYPGTPLLNIPGIFGSS